MSVLYIRLDLQFRYRKTSRRLTLGGKQLLELLLLEVVAARAVAAEEEVLAQLLDARTLRHAAAVGTVGGQRQHGMPQGLPLRRQAGERTHANTGIDPSRARSRTYLRLRRPAHTPGAYPAPCPVSESGQVLREC